MTLDGLTAPHSLGSSVAAALYSALCSAYRTSRWSICCCCCSTCGVIRLLRVLLLVYLHPVTSTVSPRVTLCADRAARVQSICFCLSDCCGRDLCGYGLLDAVCAVVLCVLSCSVMLCCVACAMLCDAWYAVCCRAVCCAVLCTLYTHLWSQIRFFAAVLDAPLVGILAQAYPAHPRS